MNAPPVIHVVDDDDSFRSALLRLLEAGGFEARGHASAGDFLLEPVADRPGCILLDLNMPGPSGLDLQDALERHGISLPVVFLTAHATVPAGIRAMKAGAVDFLTKPVNRADLFDAVRRALARDAATRASSAEALALRARFEALTPRERAVFDALVAGRLNKEIAAALGVAERTIKTERAHLMVKLGARSAAELGAIAERLLWLSRRGSP